MPALPSNDEDVPPSMAAQVVRELLQRHGIARHRQSAVIGEFFALSRTAAYRRVHGIAAWTLEELDLLAKRFDETLPQMLAGGRSLEGVQARLEIGTAQVSCRVWLAEEGTVSHDSFVAIESAGTYAVVLRGSLPSSFPSKWHRIARIEIDQKHGGPARIAVMDGDREASKALCSQLGKRGYDAASFGSPSALMKELERSTFDGYILEWKARGGSVAPAIKLIRSKDGRAAIAVLTAHLRDGTSSEKEIGAAQITYNFRLFEKPAQTDIIVGALVRDGLPPTLDLAAL